MKILIIEQPEKWPTALEVARELSKSGASITIIAPIEEPQYILSDYDKVYRSPKIEEVIRSANDTFNC